MEAYLDNAATTRVFPEVRKMMVHVMEEDFGNPSSKHTKGITAENYIKEAKETICTQLKCKPKEIIFTSGGTESNNMAFIGTAIANRRAGKHVITTRIEHASVHKPMAYLEEMGYDVTYLPVDSTGRVSVEELENAIREDTFLISIMYVNNEVGSVQPIEQIGQMLKKKHPQILFHVDAIQAFGKYKIVPKKLGVDMMSVSGHKIHGPKGSGFLYVNEKVKIRPILFGGGQQDGMRSGTENVPAIAGLGVAVKEIYTGHSEKRAKLYELKKRLIAGLQDVDGVTINALIDPIEETAPHIVSVSFANTRSEVMLHALAQKGVFVSSGSACSSNHPELSGTLQAIGVKSELLDSTLRFSFSVMTTSEEIDYAIEVVKEVLPVLRKFTRH
ncbi:MAG: cysteine desulfurase NifS [Clostridiaceae bacterium]|nr:MAG: cysteine desulfurase NifS [Clostridiaceae bacterium]